MVNLNNFYGEQFNQPSLMKSFTAFLLMATCISHGQERAAFVVGNNSYSFARPLQTAVPDATAVSAMLQSFGFSVTELHDASSDDFSDGLAKFLKEAATAKDIVVYFAGHGVESHTLKDNFLIPVDAKLEKESHLENQAFSLTRLIDRIQGLPAQARFIVLDCCRNNPLEGRSWAGGRGNAGLAAIDLQRLDGSTMVVYSAAPGKVASDRLDEDDLHSPFAAVFLEEIGRSGANALTVISSVEERVAEITTDRQRPKTFFSGNLAPFNRFSFNGRETVAPIALKPSRPRIPASSPLLQPSKLVGRWRVTERVVPEHGGFHIEWDYTAVEVKGEVHFTGTKTKVDGKAPTKGELAAVSKIAVEKVDAEAKAFVEEMNFRGEKLFSRMLIFFDESGKAFSASNYVGDEVVSKLTGNKRE